MRAEKHICIALVALMALPACAAVKGAKSAVGTSPVGADEKILVSYPAPILGQWEPGPKPCRLPLDYDSDAGFTVLPTLLQGYERSNEPHRVQRVSEEPQVWRIESTERHAEDSSRVTDIFVLRGDYLTVTDGQRSTTYRRCHKD